MNAAAKHQPDLLERPASLLVPTWVRQPDPAPTQLHVLTDQNRHLVGRHKISYFLASVYARENVIETQAIDAY